MFADLNQLALAKAQVKFQETNPYKHLTGYEIDSQSELKTLRARHVSNAIKQLEATPGIALEKFPEAVWKEYLSQEADTVFPDLKVYITQPKEELLDGITPIEKDVIVFWEPVLHLLAEEGLVYLNNPAEVLFGFATYADLYTKLYELQMQVTEEAHRAQIKHGESVGIDHLKDRDAVIDLQDQFGEIFVETYAKYHAIVVDAVMGVKQKIGMQELLARMEAQIVDESMPWLKEQAGIVEPSKPSTLPTGDLVVDADAEAQQLLSILAKESIPKQIEDEYAQLDAEQREMAAHIFRQLKTLKVPDLDITKVIQVVVKSFEAISSTKLAYAYLNNKDGKQEYLSKLKEALDEVLIETRYLNSTGQAIITPVFKQYLQRQAA